MKQLMFLKELILISQINQKTYDLSLFVFKRQFQYQLHVCNGYHDLSMVVYDLNNFMIFNIKGIDYRCDMFNISKNYAIKLLNNPWLDNKGVL